MRQLPFDFDRPRARALETPELWLKELFSSQAARDGQVIRRKSRDIERYVGWDRFVTELGRRGYRAVENAGQVVIFCNQAPLRTIFDPTRPR